MSYRQRAYAKAEAIGATIDDDGWTLMLDAPARKIFSGNGTHCIAYDLTDGYTAFGDTKPVWWYLIDDLKYGLEDCTIARCEICEERCGS